MKRIGIVSLSPGNGSRFLLSVVSPFFQERTKTMVNAIELGTRSLFDVLGMDKRFAFREFVSYKNCIENKGDVDRIENREQGVRWLLPTPEDRREEPISYEESYKIFYQLTGNYSFFCMDMKNWEATECLFSELDHIVVVIDPLPSKLLQGYEKLERIKLLGKPCTYVVNRCCQGMNRRELKNFLRIKAYIPIAEVPREVMYSAEYRCRFLLEFPDIKKQLVKPLTELASCMEQF